MDIVLHSFGMPFNGETVEKRSLGGSESAAYYQARGLARRGHRVTVFTSSTEEGIWDGVTYCYAGQPQEGAPLGERFEFYARNTPHDVLIIQRHPVAFHGQFASKVNLWQLHDLALYRSAGMAAHNMWQVDAVTCVSEWHKKQVCDVYGFNPDFVQVVPNGVDPLLYEYEVGEEDDWLHLYGSKANVPPNGFLMLYQSRPERGLEHLVRPGGIMDRLKDTNAHLLICGYDNTTGPMVGYYNQLNAWADELPNVTRIGALTKPQLAALQKSCDLLCYPSEFEEVSCITAMEAMHAGLPMLASECGALPETCADAGVPLIELKDGKADEDEFIACIRKLVHGSQVRTVSGEYAIHALAEMQIEAAKTRTWSTAVDRLEEVIEGCFEKRKGTLDAALRHSVEHSDIRFAHAQIAPIMRDGGTQIELRARDELDELYAFVESSDAYKAHYDKHQTVYYNDFEDKVIGEDVTRTSRFTGVAQLVEQDHRLKGRPLRVLDYGCAHGHYLMRLAKAFPESRFVGVDVSERAIAAATKWAMRDGLTNVSLHIGDQALLKDLPRICPLRYSNEEEITLEGSTARAIKKAERDYFDVIMACEVVEHVPDWQALLEDLRSLLAPGGLLIVTTPYGRWEWSGTEAFREAREHLHHFERRDIVEICGNNPTEIFYAPAGHDKTGKVMGSWIWAVRPEQPFGEIDVDRKRNELCPRETLSACMIVKDGEKTLRKSVESFIDWVDEVVIAIDPATKDRTREVIEQLKTDYRWKPFNVVDGVRAIEEGFDVARNLSVQHACGDWILWVDADEEVQAPWNMWKYLRPSQHDAFGFPQIHYSADPERVLTTDYPCRLFRNRKGIRFFGVVHEHPEIEPGKSIPRSALRHDVKFLHSGYVDEEVRRSRYRRNLPLLHRDLEKYPTRGLNRFLWLRDIAQGLMFEHEQTGGAILEGQRERALQGIDLWQKIIEQDPLRMAMDSLQFYSHCVETLGGGFEADISYSVATQQAPDLACRTQFKGRFVNRDHYSKLMRKIEQEATRHYESKYL